FAVAAFTAQGIAGAVVGLFARGLAAALLVGAASALERRLGTTALARLAGLPGEAPRLAAVVAIGLATSLGVPCLAGFWGPMLALLGGFGRHPALAVLLGLALVASAAAHLRAARAMLLGTFDEAWRSSAALEAHRGKMPDLTSRELGAMGAVMAIVVLVGVWPSPLIAATLAAAADISAVID